MATTDVVVDNSTTVKNGTIIINCLPNGTIMSTVNDIVKNSPTPTEIEAKYTNRFDDITYYTT